MTSRNRATRPQAAVDVLGVSFGGGVAQEFAHRAPNRTRRLVLAATPTGALMVPASPRS